MKSSIVSIVAGGVLAATAAASSSPQETPFAPLWTHTSGAENWVGRTVSIGAGGSQVCTQFGPFQDYTRILSSFDVDPPAPVWQLLSSATTFHHSVDSAETTDTHVSLYDVYADAGLQMRKVLLKKHSLSSGTWTHEFALQTNGHDSLAVRIARDGGRIVTAVHDIWTNKTQVSVFGPASSVPQAQFHVDVMGPFRGLDLSADGSTLYLAGALKIAIVALPGGALLYQAYVFDPLYNAHAISGDGARFAYGTNGKVVAFARAPSGTTYAPLFTHELAGANYCDRLDLSDDGSTLACAFNFSDTFKTVVIRALDCDQQGAVTMSDTVTGQGSLANVAGDVSIAADGERFAVGLWGDQAGAAHEVRVYARGQDAALATYDLPGSVFDVDLSADGERLATASKAVHANVAGGDGRIDLFAIEHEDLRLSGIPHAGSVVSVELDGNPGSPARLLWSSQLGATPTVLPFGTLYLSSTSFQWQSMGLVDADGVATTSFGLPATPGTTLYLQGVTVAPRHISAKLVAVTSVP